MAGLGPPEGEKTEKRGGERPGLWRVVGKAARAWRCAEWVRMCWSWWMIELNRTELNLTEQIDSNFLSIFKPKRPSIEWCMLFYARVTREWCEKIFIFFSILECVGTSDQWFWTFLWSCGVYQIHPTRITASGFALTAHQVGRKRLHCLFPSFRMEPKSDGSGHSWPNLSVKGAKQKFLYVIRKGHGQFSISMLENMLSHVYDISF